MVEVMGRYSNHPELGERITDLLNIVPATPVITKTRTNKQIHRRLPTDRVAGVVVGYEGGMTVRELAEVFGVGRNTVSKILKREGVTTRHKGLTESQTATATRLYYSGKSLVKVAEMLGVSRGAVNNALVKAGVQLRPRRGWRY